MVDFDLVLQIAETHLRELGLEVNCNIEFFPLTKRVLVPENVFGIYDSAEKTAYVRVGSVPRMVETIAHECAHHFLLHNSELGRELVGREIIIKMHEDGRISTEIGHRTLRLISSFVNEGFACFVGCYAIRRFAEVVRKHVAESEYGKDMLDVALSELASSFDGRGYDYYYGRLEFERIANIFGNLCAATAATASMNVKYSIPLDEVEEYYIKMRNAIYRKDYSEPSMHHHPRFYSPAPHFRLLTFSRILPNFVVVYDAKPDYFISLIEKYLGEDFLYKNVKKLSYPVSKLKLGYLIGKFLKGDYEAFHGYEIPDEVKVRIKYGLDVKAFCRNDSEIYAGYLISELEGASYAKAEEILRELNRLGISDYDKIWRRLPDL